MSNKNNIVITLVCIPLLIFIVLCFYLKKWKENYGNIHIPSNIQIIDNNNDRKNNKSSSNRGHYIEFINSRPTPQATQEGLLGNFYPSIKSGSPTTSEMPLNKPKTKPVEIIPNYQRVPGVGGNRANVRARPAVKELKPENFKAKPRENKGQGH